ncbi:PKD domain-containing protein [Methanosarcina barkeri]|nr:PKD domain-containing protein [Methanosarcina barkeri]
MNKNTLKIFIICLLLFLVTATMPALGSDWTQFQKDVYHAGVTTDRAPITDPTDYLLSWNYSLGGNIDSAPLVAGEMMYVLAGNNHIYAFDRTTGSLAWEQSTSGSAGFTIGSAAVGNGIIFVPTSDGKIFAFDAKTGTLKWNKTVGSGKQLDTPITYSEGKIYFGEAMGGHKYYCYDEEGNEIWSRTSTTQTSTQGSYYWAGAAVIGDNLIYGDDDGHIISVNKDTGADISEIDVSEEFGVTCGKIRSSVLYVEELKRIYFTSTGGYCFAIGFNPADGTFNTNDKHSEKVWYSTTTPTYYKGRIYIGTGAQMYSAGKGVYCLDSDLSGVIWNYPANVVQSSPALSTYYDDGDGEVYIYFTVNNATGGVYCLKDLAGSTSPELVWSYKDAKKTQYSLQGVAISDGWIYFGADKKYVFGLTTKDSQASTAPSASFSGSPLSGNSPLEVQFTDKSTGAPTSWAWDFDNDGTVDSKEQNPSYIYNDTGSYTVKLTVSNGNGSDAKEIQDMIKVTEEEQEQPVTSEGWYQFHKDAQHSGYTSSTAPDSANLAWTAEPLNDTYSLVPSSSVAIAEGKVFCLCNGPTDEYGNPLTSYGQLVAFDENTGQEVWNVTVEAPEWGSWSSPAYDSGKVFASAGKQTYCINASTGEVIWTFHNPTDLASCDGGPSIGDGKVFVSDWDGGNYYCLDESNGGLLWTFKVDGAYAQGTPAYKDGKVYLTCWSSTNAVYCVNAETGETIWKNDGFENGPCGSVTITDEGLYVTVFGFGTSDGIYKLDLTDGSVLWGRSDVSPSDSTPTVLEGKVYLSTGTSGYSELKTYCLDASDGQSLWETNASDNIGDWACSVAVADGKVFTGGAASGLFTGSSTLYAFDAETGSQVWSYEGCGCSPAIADGMVFSIGSGKIYAFKETQGSLLEAKFSSNVSTGKAPLTVSFTDESTGEGITSWDWDFDNDGAIDSTEQNPVHKYTAAGTYTVNLTVSNEEGSDSEVKAGYIKVSSQSSAKPVAAFTASPTSGKTPLNVAFTDTSTGSPTSWFWKFGDGSKSFLQNPIHKYSKAGIYTVNLTVKNAKGKNTVTKTQYIKVITKPVANFNSSVTSGKTPLTVKFTDTSTGTPAKWRWDFGDGSKSFLQNPVHKYSKAGTYTVNLTVKNTKGSNTVTKTEYIKVITKPVANFTSSVTSGKAPLKVKFTDTSTGTPAKWRWDFGDGSDSFHQNPIHKYSKAGTYTVNLTVKNAAGRNTVTKTEYIKIT